MMTYKLDKEAIKNQARGRWLAILPALDSRLSEACERVGVHVPCPMGTGSRDGFRLESSSVLDGHAFHNQVDNKILSDGFGVLAWLNNWSFYESLKAVHHYLNDGCKPELENRTIPHNEADRLQARKETVKKILSYAKATPNQATELYLHNRGLDAAININSPSLLHHAGVSIQYQGKAVKDASGAWVTVPALIGRLSSSRGWLGVSLIRVTKDGYKADEYIQQVITKYLGEKTKYIASKQLLKTTDSMSGGAIRLGKAGSVLCVGEGLETMLAVATRLDTLSVAACCTAQLLEAFEVPPQVKRLLIFADKDRQGRGEEAAHRLSKRLIGKIRVEILLPPSPIAEGSKGVDWLDDQAELAALQHIVGAQ
ncbi:toprim domain-containing protein [uncultured Thiothrix sp.]|uniref:toprim domain-containing protein n=1 Tax=uncultured Thiothrix sp. TaxID=223185 RepID=UPI0026036B45|nr:toprim domain-containing protein [uncultured Thiothrix sp.]